MEKLKNKNLFIIIAIYLIITILGMLNNAEFYKNVINPIFWFFILVYCLINGCIKCKRDTRIQIYAILFSCFYIIFYFSLGCKFGFSKSPYNHKFFMIIKNWLIQVIPIIGIEITKGVLVQKNKKVMVIIIFIVFIMLEINYYTMFNLIYEKENLMKYIFSNILCLIAQNLIAIYLAIESSYSFILIFRILFKSFFIVSPILPKLDWYIEGTIGILIPFFIYLVFQQILAKKRKRKNNKGRFKNAIFVSIFVFCICLVCFMTGIFSYGPIDILSNSMSPTFNRGDVIVFYKPNENYLKNIPKYSIIVYKFKNQNITHRVIERVNKNGEILYRTKGDKNNVSDRELVKINQIMGIYKFHIKYVGFPSIWLYEYLNQQSIR